MPRGVYQRKPRTPKPEQAVVRYLRPRPGFRDVANKMTDHVLIAHNVIGKKRKPLHEETS